MIKHRIARKLLLPHIAGFFILLFLFGTGYFALRTAYLSQHLITEEMAELHLVGHLKLAVIRVVMPANDYLIEGGDPNEEANFSLLAAQAEQLFKQLGVLKFDRSEEHLYFKLASNKFQQVTALAKRIFPFKEPYGNPEAGRLMEEMDAQAEDALQALDKFEEIALEEHNEALKKVEVISQRSLRIFIAALILSILGLIFLGVILPWFITQPIIKLHRGAELIGKGNLSHRISIRTGDELQELANEFNRMAEHLQASYSQLEEKVKERTKDLQIIKDRLTTVTEGIEEGIMLLDKDFKIIWANKKIMQTSGFKIGEVIDNYCYKVTHKRQKPCQPPYDICPITEVLKTQKPVTLNHTHFDKEGNEFYAEVSSYPLRNEKGEINQFVHVSRDVTERKRMEQALLESEQKYRTILYTAMDGFWLVDTPHGRFLDVNEAYCNLMGYSRQELLSMSIQDIEASETPEETAQHIQKVIELGGDRFVTRHRCKDGKIVDIEVSVNYINLMGGLLFCFLRDITQRLKLENKLKENVLALEKSYEELTRANQELKQTRAQLIQSSKMAAIGQLASGVAHEINNPLTGVLNNVQLIKMEIEEKKDFNPGEFKDILGTVEESALRCKKIIRSLLEFSHASMGQQSEISPNELVEGVIILVGHEIELENITIQKELAEGIPKIRGDIQLLQQVIFNLISNAKWAIGQRSGKEGGLITLKSTYESEKNLVCVYVSDTGIGILPENIDRIFEPFFTTKNVGEGTGLGLSIAYKIIKEHKGTIEVESQPNKGTTFKIALPAIIDKEVKGDARKHH